MRLLARYREDIVEQQFAWIQEQRAYSRTSSESLYTLRVANSNAPDTPTTCSKKLDATQPHLLHQVS